MNDLHTGYRILIVEDDEMNQDMLSKRLGRRGFDVAVAADGEQALELARRILPDVVLMDLRLPLMDGCEATRCLKSDPRTSDIPVIALTADAMVGDRERALAAGCDDYDIKPIEFTRLMGKINAFLDGPPNHV